MPYITPSELPVQRIFRCLVIPNETNFLGAVSGALLTLTEPENWEQVDGLTVAETVQAIEEMVEKYFELPMILGGIFPCATSTPPLGTILCDGSDHLREDFPALYEVLDPAYIVDADTFKTPDLTNTSTIMMCMIAG